MKIAYLDCFSGISGDMLLGALLSAGCELEQLERYLRQLPLGGWKMTSTKVMRNGLAATRAVVECSESRHHRSLADILKLIEKASLPPAIADRASAIFRRLAEAEADVHDLPIDRVHFHEVGAVDAIIDIVGASVGLELLGVGQVVCSSLNVGGGNVKTQHGMLPVPAPATAELLRGAPTYSSGIDHELVTPTGAAIVATLASHYGAQPAMTVGAIGLGAGAAEFAGHPNILRLFVGDTPERAIAEPNGDIVVMLEANLDDMNPQIYGYFVDRALAAGALDVFSTPVYMKKNRPGQLVTVLCDSATEKTLTELLFRETTTLGVRRSMATRQTLQRELVTVETAFGAIRVKVARLNGRTLNAAPEYDDCRAAASEKGVPLKHVLAEASYEFQKQLGPGNWQPVRERMNPQANNAASIEKQERLLASLRGLGSVIVAFSGGADSAFLAWAAKQALGENVLAVTALSPSFSQYDREQATSFAREWGLRHEFVTTREIENPLYVANELDRCYHCKNELFGELGKLRMARGFAAVAYGVNVDDLADFRPGHRAAREHDVATPLLDAGLTKAEVRELSRSAGLSTWDRPASACLASRIPYGMPVQVEELARIERAERVLRELGFRQFRVRAHGDLGRIEVAPEELPRALRLDLAQAIAARLREAGFTYVTLDLEGYRQGSLNAVLKVI